ncbi:MAG: T9SS type A sorting domain-containing protein [Bacteroidetes bacterium]|nr:MAG: T9SS type A sorting domain-containing protein [Bacteroidota bacterium]
MKHLFTLILVCVFALNGYGQFWTRTNASIAATGTDARMLATHCGDTVFGVAPTSQGYFLTVSTDKGATWSSGQPIFDTLIDGYTPKIAAIYGIHDRLYATISLANSIYYNIYYYSEDLGNSWTVDTAGLARSFNPAYIHPFEISELSNGYMVAYNSLQGAYFKHKSGSTWVHQPTSSSWTGTYNLDFTYIGNTWYALNNANQSTGEVLNRSTDYGQTWSTVNISGLPSTFTPYNLVSNHDDKMYISGSIAGSTPNRLYYSDDNGVTWDSTNTATYGQYTYGSVYMRDLYAVEDYVFTTFYPTTGDTVSRILTSNTAIPNFSLCDVSGLPIYAANIFSLAPPILNYFSIDDKLFITYSDDIYTSTPGFVGTDPGIGMVENSGTSFKVYPNPAENVIHIEAENDETVRVYDMSGQIVNSFNVHAGENTVELDIPNGLYFINMGNLFERLVINK